MSDQELQSAALRVLNADPGASMSKIADGCGISRATLNRRFASREALITALGRQAQQVWADALDHSGVEQAAASGDAEQFRAALRDLLSRYVAQADSHGFALTDTFLEGVPELAQQTQRLTAREVAVMSAGQELGVLRGDVPATWLGWLVFGHLVAARDALRLQDLGRRGLEELVWTTFMNGVAR